MSIRIVLADDHKILRAGLRAMIVEQPDMEVVGEAENGRTGGESGPYALARCGRHGYRYARFERY